MDIIFAVVTTEDTVYVSDEVFNVQLDGKRSSKIQIPLMHDRVHSLSELNELRKVLHKRIDSILDSSQELYTGEVKKKNTKRETIRVFNCFSDEPEMVEVEI